MFTSQICYSSKSTEVNVLFTDDNDYVVKITICWAQWLNVQGFE